MARRRSGSSATRSRDLPGRHRDLPGRAERPARAVRAGAVPGTPGYAVLLVDHGAPDDHSRMRSQSSRQAAPPLFAFDTPIPYTALQQMFDESAPWGILAYEKAVYLDGADRRGRSTSSPATSAGEGVSHVVHADLCARRQVCAPVRGETAFGGSRQTRYVAQHRRGRTHRRTARSRPGLGAVLLVRPGAARRGCAAATSTS